MSKRGDCDTMSVKVRISYEKPQELQEVLKHLKPIVKSCKPDKGKNGAFKKAYVELNVDHKALI